MGRSRKRVVLLIVEGSSEESLLYNRLRQLFGQHEIRLEVQHGDIFYDLKRRTKSIKSIIGDAVKEFMQRNKFKADDILAILHVIDTDGCFIPAEDIVIDNTQTDLTLYCEDSISVPNEKQRKLIEIRNEERSNNINIMKTLTTILPAKINYRIYYFSRNLEHVLFNEPNPEKGSKVAEVEKFIDELQLPIEDFLKQYMPTMSSECSQSDY